jgi:hypothetical protein
MVKRCNHCGALNKAQRNRCWICCDHLPQEEVEVSFPLFDSEVLDENNLNKNQCNCGGPPNHVPNGIHCRNVL